MVDERELQAWIARLECEESSWSNYEKLAILYAIRNQQGYGEPQASAAMYSAAPAPELVGGESDFLRAVSGVDPQEAWAIMDDLMDTLRLVNERAYNGVMRKLDAL